MKLPVINISGAAAGEIEFADELLIEGFAPVDASDYVRTLEWDRAAKAAGYPYPA